MEIIARKVIMFFANLPQCTPKIAIYNEFGILPIRMEIYKKKIMMWRRIKTKTTNNLIKQTMREQVTHVLPWFKELKK